MGVQVSQLSTLLWFCYAATKADFISNYFLCVTQKSETETTSVKESLFTDEVKQEIFDAVQNYGVELGQSFYRTFGVDAWFGEYIKSEKFAELSKDFKDEAYNAFIGLKQFLNAVDEIHSRHGLGAYYEKETL